MLRKRKRDALYGSIGLEDEDGNDLLEMLPDDHGDPTEELAAMTGYESLRAAIDHLDEKYRNVLYLRCVMEYSVPETAKLLGITEAAVYKRLQRARTLLREEMRHDED